MLYYGEVFSAGMGGLLVRIGGDLGDLGSPLSFAVHLALHPDAPSMLWCLHQ